MLPHEIELDVLVMVIINGGPDGGMQKSFYGTKNPSAFYSEEVDDGKYARVNSAHYICGEEVYVVIDEPVPF